ncbi:MAG TPA: hypothetical protein VG734_00480 [Lacunisphaera sp.]|nr:hypothetical protein [Lacunisphaera sp.]
MSLFLKIVGGLALAFCCAVVLFVFYIRSKLRGIAKEIRSAAPTPSTIELKPDPEADWVNADQARDDLAALEACGYVRGAIYSVDGMPGVGLVAFSHPANGGFGCYYDHPSVAGWFDLCAVFADGLELTVSSAPTGGQLDSRPGTEKIRLPGRPAAELHARLQQRIAGQALRHHVPENFAAEFCGAYARDMAWRNAKEGTSQEEFNRIAASNGKNLTEEQLKAAFILTKRKEIDQWSQELLKAFARHTTLSVAEWQQHEGRMIIFRESFHPDAYLSYLRDTAEISDAAAEGYRTALAAGLDLRGLLAKITADTGQQFVKLGEVDQPRKTEFYGVQPKAG